MDTHLPVRGLGRGVFYSEAMWATKCLPNSSPPSRGPRPFASDFDVLEYMKGSIWAKGGTWSKGLFLGMGFAVTQCNPFATDVGVCPFGVCKLALSALGQPKHDQMILLGCQLFIFAREQGSQSDNLP